MPNLDSAVWFTTFACNLKCHYCWQVQATEFGQYKPGPLGDSAEPWIKAWNKLKPKILDITGGEPFMIPWFQDFLDGLDPEIKLGLTTNITYDMTKFVQRVDPKRFVNITCSCHPTENGTTKNPNNLYIFTGKALLLKNRGFPITINFVTWPEQLWLIEDFKSWFEGKGLRFHVDAYSSISYYPFEFSEKEKAHASKYLDTGRKPHPWTEKYGENYQVMCNGGLKHLSVQPDGTAHRCILEHQINLNKCGNILDPDFKLWDEERSCDEYYRCPGCDRDKVKVKFVKELEPKKLIDLPNVTIV